ncbi:GrpB family protein [Microcoleus sp. Pol11C1]
MGEKAVTVHHIGSTAMPSIYAKPIIDFLIEVKYLAKVES